ncbi:MAG: RNA methyltransferase [Kiritimatiellae bacterium]|nr:RNA methyltransferase [Kiritimatiellia bacterium]
MNRKALENIRVVLVGTLYGGNVGSVCRAMANCGMHSLRLVAPDPGLTWEFARKMAVHATDVLDARETYPTLREAVADCVAVAGTSRRGGLYRRRFLDAREAAPELVSLAETGPVALVFGREDKGLLNEEILLCTHVLRLPAAPEYPSYNLAQSAVLACHELFRAAAGPVRNKELEASPPATMDLRERTLDALRAHLLDVGFMDESDADRMMEGFNRIFSRGAVTEADMKLAMGAIRQTRWAIDHPRGK